MFNSFAFYYNITLQRPAIYTEIYDQAEWGTLYFGMSNVSLWPFIRFFLSHPMMQGDRIIGQSGLDADCRGNFTSRGELNSEDDYNRPISDGHTVFAFSYEFYNISVTPAPVVWAIGYTTDLVINYTDLSGAPPTPRSPYYKTRYSNDKDMVSTYSTPGQKYV